MSKILGSSLSNSFVFALTTMAVFQAQAQAQAQDVAPPYAAEVEKTLRDFQSSDKMARQIMDGKLPHFSEGAHAIDVIPTSQKNLKDFIKEKDRLRKELNAKLNGPGAGRAGIGANDKVEDLVDNDKAVVTSIVEMADKGLKSAKLAENPWSDTYWPIYMGTTAFRFADSSISGLGEDWKVRFDYFNKNIATPVADVNVLSPAEKYDLLVGDNEKTLTKLQWGLGGDYYTKTKGVETWMGLCHGWSPASFMLDRPTSAIKVTAADGKTEIEFYPSDIKALSTLLWANYQYQARFIGGRCNIKDPTRTAAGRIKDDSCFDTNPGTWHMAIINQIGVSKRSFVMDATYDIEVWNQPVLGYNYSYFNPITGKSVWRLKNAMVSMDDFKKSGKDKFAEFRKPGVAGIVGVAMEVNYIRETEPTTCGQRL